MFTFKPVAFLLSLHSTSGILGLLLAWGLLTSVSQAQSFLLTAPELGLNSTAHLSEQKLEIIDAQGAANIYDRDSDMDTEDGQWMGFRHRQTGKVLLWPASHSGHLQIGTSQRGVLRFQPSKMRIQPLNPVGNAPASDPSSLGRSPSGVKAAQSEWSRLTRTDLFSRIYTEPNSRLPEPQPIHLVSHDAGGVGWAFTQQGSRLACVRQYRPDALWWAAPAGPGLVRLQWFDAGRVMAVSVAGPQQLQLAAIANDPRQLWRLCPGFQQSGFFYLENIHFGGHYLTHLGLGNVGLQPMMGLPNQMWSILSPPANQIALLQPLWRSVSREIRPNPPLAPSEVELFNSHSSAVMVLLGDQRQSQALQPIRIEAGSAVNVTVERDPGATLVEVVEVLSPLGDWSREELVTPIPSSSLMDLSVYEEFLQSIAIDRTGKSPNRIEDMNYAPRSVGLFFLPAGAELPDQARIDVYAQAKSADNPGAVRRLPPELLEKERKDPIQTILERELDREDNQPVQP